MEDPKTFDGIGRPREIRRFRKTHLENILWRGSQDRDPRYPQWGPKGPNFFFEKFSKRFLGPLGPPLGYLGSLSQDPLGRIFSKCVGLPVPSNAMEASKKLKKFPRGCDNQCQSTHGQMSLCYPKVQPCWLAISNYILTDIGLPSG